MNSCGEGVRVTRRPDLRLKTHRKVISLGVEFGVFVLNPRRHFGAPRTSDWTKPGLPPVAQVHQMFQGHERQVTLELPPEEVVRLHQSQPREEVVDDPVRFGGSLTPVVVARGRVPGPTHQPQARGEVVICVVPEHGHDLPSVVPTLQVPE